MIFEASLVAIWAFLCGIDKYDVALNIHRPLITGPVVGLIMGDMQIGLIAGATLELAWLGLVPNAGAQPPDVTLGTIAAVAFAVMTGQSPEVAMGIGMPIAVLMQMIVIGFFAMTAFTMGIADRHAAAANGKGISQLLVITLMVRSLLYAVVAFVTVYFGEHAASWIDENTPKVLLEGLGIGAKMVPAIGFAMLLKIMWSKEVAGVFFIGFVMTTYLKLPIMAIAVLGASAAALYFFFSGNGNNKNGSQEAEDFEDGI
ncbi:PTS N-acetylgalactosamine transporter subunit IIC [Moellerella wisconsensis]|uniref:PTS mannose/fructose/sorbose/N-acetylgalactosamine transporter subunit IIC n=2 Tax=Moellerella wisconsensis TaxID=158849 RepID=A0ACD3Y4U9_9GAMM|nr:PTS N-acetylgalactosamine transporter subunit IIC [Moellerella wisconsensis]KLN96598.1 PTS system N-acetylgalactosamine-specific transporter subunit IIC [Moellerella wisconsensis]UNH23452.1 PTS mannose/fructose/sorbose/N-acetylgalactosamine transporter subunit IIC [Moellerella wisconsensis]UNH26532.1 PTS mannose/fructose/sorbose/N-acetylgalactosamine transporter subunit IIC [Moellerella wisconsensis]UNH29948.1 PTS mannose/fructose/sorbose/N-acetylgalactosamine transporter subunit IIC [Moelle